MIDGITSRPFSAKTLPPMVKSGNKEIEDEVIRNSRELYCRSKETIEREINNWSGMSLGENDGQGNVANTGSTSGYGNSAGSSGVVGFTAGGLEKYEAVCSLCGKQTSVPFKPDAGRPVYCKECTAKIKSGEVKVAKGPDNQVRYDDSKFFKPLADLGIEYTPKNNQENKIDSGKAKDENADEKIVDKGLVNAVKKVFKKENIKTKDNLGLKEIINKTLAGELEEAVPSMPDAVPLDVLKDKPKASSVGLGPRDIAIPSSKDRSASKEDMNKLKDLIMEKVAPVAPDKEPVVQAVEIEAPKATPVVEPVVKKEEPVTPPKVEEILDVPLPPKKPKVEEVKKEEPAPIPKKPVKEVPEDVLRKVLE